MAENGKLRVAVVMGGVSSEHEISVQSGAVVCNTLPRDRFLIKPVLVTRGNGWLVYPEWLEGDFAGMPPVQEPVQSGAALIALIAAGIEVVFLALHGPGGEDGAMQGFFQTAGIPYTFSGVLGSALGMDKITAKRVMQAVGIPTAPFFPFPTALIRKNPGRLADRIEKRYGYPCPVKISDQGSSYNMGIAKDREELFDLLERIAPSGEYAFAEEYIAGREITCAVFERPGEPAPTPLPPTEIVPLTSEFFDLHAKYTPGATDEITPARISPALTRRVQETAVRVHTELRCSGVSRTDMIVRGRGDDAELFVLEINTIPGMTATSLIPQAARAAGIPFAELLEQLVLFAHEKRSR